MIEHIDWRLPHVTGAFGPTPISGNVRLSAAWQEENMDDSTSAALTEITVRIPADLARRLGHRRRGRTPRARSAGAGRIPAGASRPGLLGLATRAKLDEFLTWHGVFGTYTADDLERDRHDLQRLGF